MSKAVQLCWPCMSDLFCWSIPSNSRFQWPHKILQWHEDPEIIKFLQIFFKLPDWEGRHPIRISTETRDIICLIWLGGYWSAPVHWLDSAQISNWLGGGVGCGAGAMGKSWDVSIREHKWVSGFTGWDKEASEHRQTCAIVASKTRKGAVLPTYDGSVGI